MKLKSDSGNLLEEISDKNSITLLNFSKALAISASICAIGYWLADLTGIGGTSILIITAICCFPRYIFFLSKLEALKELI